MSSLPRFYNVAGRRPPSLVFAVGVVAVLVAAWPAHASHKDWTRQLPWRIEEAKVVRVKAWSCESSVGVSWSPYPSVRWDLPVTARRYRTLGYWRTKLNQCRAHRSSVGNLSAWLCIHRYEGAWNDPDPPYFGGLQMDLQFQRTYGLEFLRRWGTADHWPPRVQMQVAERARRSGRGYYPWPNSARYCGLI